MAHDKKGDHANFIQNHYQNKKITIKIPIIKR